MAGQRGSKRAESVVTKCGHTIILILTGRPGLPSSERKIAEAQNRNCWSCQFKNPLYGENDDNE